MKKLLFCVSIIICLGLMFNVFGSNTYAEDSSFLNVIGKVLTILSERDSIDLSNENVKDNAINEAQNSNEKINTASTIKTSNTSLISNAANNFSMNITLNNNNLYEGIHYTITNKDKIKVSLNDANTGNSFIYYMFMYGDNYSSTYVRKISGNVGEIVVPDEIVGDNFELSIWAANVRSNKSYSTNPIIIPFKYTRIGGIYSYNFDISYRGVVMNDNMAEKAIVGDEVKVLIPKVTGVKSASYRWDNGQEISLNLVDDKITIPVYNVGSTHTLTVYTKDDNGRVKDKREIKFEIVDKIKNNNLKFFATYDGRNLDRYNGEIEAKAEHNILVRAAPRDAIKSIEYKWDNGDFIAIEDDLATVMIPKEFAKDSKHKFYIRVNTVDGKSTEEREYSFFMK